MPPIEFRVYAGPDDQRGLFVRVRVFSARRVMLKTLRAELRAVGIHRRIPNTTLAYTSAETRRRYDRHGRGRTSGCFAVITLWRRRMGTEVMAHEFTHAVLAYAQRRGVLDLLPKRREWSEELVAYAMGRMCKRFVSRATKLGLYE